MDVWIELELGKQREQPVQSCNTANIGPVVANLSELLEDGITGKAGYVVGILDLHVPFFDLAEDTFHNFYVDLFCLEAVDKIGIENVLEGGTIGIRDGYLIVSQGINEG